MFSRLNSRERLRAVRAVNHFGLFVVGSVNPGSLHGQMDPVDKCRVCQSPPPQTPTRIARDHLQPFRLLLLPRHPRRTPPRPVRPCTGGAQKLRVPNRKRAGLSENSYVTDNPTRAKYRICPGTVITIRLFVGSTDFATTPECAEFFFIFRKEYYVRWRISNDILGRGCPPIYLYNHIFRNFLSLTI